MGRSLAPLLSLHLPLPLSRDAAAPVNVDHVDSSLLSLHHWPDQADVCCVLRVASGRLPPRPIRTFRRPDIEKDAQVGGSTSPNEADTHHKSGNHSRRANVPRLHGGRLVIVVYRYHILGLHRGRGQATGYGGRLK